MLLRLICLILMVWKCVLCVNSVEIHMNTKGQSFTNKNNPKMYHKANQLPVLTQPAVSK